MSRKEQKRIWTVFVLVLLIAFFSDVIGGNLKNNNLLERSPVGEEEKEISLEVNAEGVFENYEYKVIVEPENVTKEDAEVFFSEAKKEIDKDCKNIDTKILIKETYADGYVEAEWNFTPYGFVTSDGTIIQDTLSNQGSIVTANVILICGSYEERYSFPVLLKKTKLSQEQKLLGKIDTWISLQMQKEGETQVLLPEEVDGVQIQWKENREYISLRVLIVEIIAIVLLYILKEQEKKDAIAKRKREMEYIYSDIVNQLSVLVGAGMTVRQAWQRIAQQCVKRQKENPVYEAIVHMSYRLNEGESERIVYERFIEEIDVFCYRRLMQTLIGKLEKGTSGICIYLEEEEKRAYEERLFLARKLGEEASTKMLIPLMLMMILVMAVVIIPAMIGFFN